MCFLRRYEKAVEREAVEQKAKSKKPSKRLIDADI
jgi:hypothetical protein